MKNIFRALALQLIFISSCMATTITVNYQATNPGYASLSGSFAGIDLNNDNILSFSELTNWNTNYDGAGFSALNSIGDYNYATNVWTPNGLQWNQSSHDAYMTWNNWSYSASTSNNNWNFTTSSSVNGAAIPEPASIALLALGLLAIVVMRRKFAK